MKSVNRLLTLTEPPAFELINANGCSSVLLVCDHASNRVPQSLNQLGLEAAQLNSHIAWDPGAAQVAREMSVVLDAPLFVSNYSRLVIDCNRPPGRNDSIPAQSAGIVIPANANISAADALLRYQALFEPYQSAIGKFLDDRLPEIERLISVHSFAPELHGNKRPWWVGVCYRLDVDLAKHLRIALSNSIDGQVGDNRPYRIETDVDYTVPVQGESRGISSIMLEIRQDKIRTSALAIEWGKTLAHAWQEIESATAMPGNP